MTSFRQSPAEPALWLPLPQHDHSGAGAYGLVIGVSEYQTLDGTDASLGLASLYTSALTAYTFFQWLTGSYHSPETPLKACWLLLSPTAAERALVPGLADAPAASFAACETAIRAWFATMQTLFSTELEESRAVFFFSGHGFHAARDKQILLPADYAPNGNAAAISTLNLSRGLWPLPLRDEYFFLDACRSRPPGVPIEGQKILDEPRVSNLNARREHLALYATQAGGETWQPNDPAEDISIFGRALLEGLARAPADPSFCNQGFLSGDTLHRFVKKRAVQLMKDRMNRDVPRSVPRGGEAVDGCFTLVRDFDTDWWGPEALPAPPPGVEEGFRTILARSDDRRVRLDDSVAFDAVHSILDSEYATAIWQEKVLHSLARADAPSVLVMEASSRFGELSFAAEFLAEGVGPWLLELDDREQLWFAMLPPEDVYQHVYETFFTRADYELSRFEVGFAAEQPHPGLSLIAKLVRDGSEREAVTALTNAGLRAWAAGRAFGGSLLARAGRYDQLAAWLGVSNSGLDVSVDELVLSVEALRYTRATPGDLSGITERWERILEQGMPHQAAVFEMAIDQLVELDQAGRDDDPAAGDIVDDPRAAAFRKLELAYNPGGLFTSFRAGRATADEVRTALLSWRPN